MAMSWRETEDKRAALAERFQTGEFTEEVYRASLFATGMRGTDLACTIREQMEKKRGQKPAGISRGHNGPH